MELDAAQRLQQAATQLMTAGGMEALYEQILDTTRALLHADFASIQRFCPERGTDGELQLVGYRGFSAQAAKLWEWINPCKRTACGEALRTRQRVAVPDVRHSEFMAGSDDLEGLIAAGILAVQTTPLVSRSGALLGMVSTHWHEPHELSATEVRSLDVLGRLAADLIERSRAEEALWRSEAALRESEERFRATFFQAAVGIANSGTDGKWLQMNDRFCEILGYTQAELRGKTFLEITHTDDREASLTARRQLLAGEISSSSLEKRFIHKEGAIVWARLWISLVRDPDNQPHYFISVVEDITEKIQAERALRESEQRLGLARSTAHLGIWHRDLGTDVISISGEYTHLHGLEPGRTTLTHEEWLSLIHPDDRERVQALVHEARERTHRFDAEFRVVWPDASIHWILAKGTVFVDDSGRPIRSTGVTMDVTDHKQAEAALRESDERLRTSERRLIEAQRLARVGSWERYFEGAVIYWSDEMFRIFGLRIGPALHFRAFLSYVHPEDQEKIMEANQKALSSMTPEIVEYRIIRSDGEMRFIRSVIEVIGSDDPNARIRMAGATQDITEQVKARELLRESEERLQSAQRLAHVGNWEWDIQTNRIFRSEEVCRIFGMPLSSSATDYMEFFQAVQPQDRERLVQSARDALAGERTPRFLEFQITRPDGDLRTVACISEVFRDGAGSPMRMAGACQDITDQKCAEAQLRRSLDEIAHLNRVAAMGELTGSLAHELNQPLAAILSNAQAASRFLNGESPNLAEARECLNAIVEDDKRAGEVIKRVRTLLKKEESGAAPVDLNEVVGDVIRLLQNDAMLRLASVTFEPSPHLPIVRGDRVQLYQVVLNLMVNGLEASAIQPPHDRWLKVRTRGLNGGAVELTVEDSGKGIAESDLARVFEPFFTTKPEGLGMGLSISQSIVQAHGGRLWAENGREGGAVLRCVLPAPQQAASAAQA
jgi:PAS domain S-box-containing protein